MAKRSYTLEEKAALVAEVERLYQAGGRTYVSIARQLGISDTSYHTWIAAGVKPAARPVSTATAPTPKVTYSPARRAELVAKIEGLHAAGQTIKEACRAVGIGEKTFRVWRARRRPLPAMRPVEVTALVPVATPALALTPANPAPAALTLVAPGGYRIEGLAVEDAAALLRALA